MMVMNIAADKRRERKKQIQEHTLARTNMGLMQGLPGSNRLLYLILPNSSCCRGRSLQRTTWADVRGGTSL